MVGAAEPAVDDHQPSPALDGALAVFLLHRHMAVDDMARARQAELCQNAAAGGFVVVPAIIGVLDLRMGGGIGDIQPLKGGHGAAAKQRRKLAAPQIPQKILSALAGSAALCPVVATAGAGVAVIHQGTAGVAAPLKVLHCKTALRVHGHSAVVEQVSVFNVVHAALGVQKFNVLL